MIYRPYGKTGKQISLLGFGGLRFNELDTVDEAGLARCVELVKYAASKGVNYFDTAPNYCNSQSEIILGRAFREIKEPCYISTKSTILAEKNCDAVRWRIETSLKRLGLPKIHFFNMWAIIDLDQYRAIVAKGGPYEGALKAQSEGLVEHVVFSTHCTGDEIARIVDDGCFEGVTIGYNALNYKYRRRGIEAAHQKGLGVVVMNPLSGGLIPRNMRYFEFLRESPREEPVTSALRFNAAHREITCVLSGMKNKEEIDINTAALSDPDSIHPKRIENLQKRSVVQNDNLCTTCRYCDGCPADLPLFKYMDAYNMSMLTQDLPASEGKEDERAERSKAAAVFNKLKMDWRVIPEHGSNPCIQCGQCEERCTQHIKIVQRLDTMFRWANKYGFDIDQVKSKLDIAFGNARGLKVGVYGVGYHSENMFDVFHKLGRKMDFELFFFDSNPLKWGTTFMGYIVRSPETIKSLVVSRLVISSAVFQEEIYEQVKHLENESIDVVRLYREGDIPVF